MQISRSLYRYRSRRPQCAGLRERICDIAAAKRRYGYRRMHVMLRREGWAVNRKVTSAVPRSRSGGASAQAKTHRSVRAQALTEVRGRQSELVDRLRQ